MGAVVDPVAVGAGVADALVALPTERAVLESAQEGIQLFLVFLPRHLTRQWQRRRGAERGALVTVGVGAPGRRYPGHQHGRSPAGENYPMTNSRASRRSRR